MAGYSGTPLAKKLGIKAGSSVFVDGAPIAYEQLVAPLPAGVKVQSVVDSSTDIMHLFSTTKAKLASALKRSLPQMRPDAALWIRGQSNLRVTWMYTTYIELVVDGEIVDLNRIPLPPDTPIIDERFKDAKNK